MKRTDEYEPKCAPVTASGIAFSSASNERVDDGGKRKRVVAHRGSGRGADQLPVRQDEFERAERTGVGRFVGCDQIFEGDAGGRDAAAVRPELIELRTWGGMSE